MDRILIIGVNGSGKSTFANKLGKKLNREVTHLDRIYYKSGWLHTQTKAEWRETVKKIVAGDKWIVDGQYSSSLDIRVPVADTIIYFNFNKVFCLYRAILRAFDRTQPFDKAEGNLNTLSFRLIKSIILFPKSKILEILKPYKQAKNIIILNNDREVANYLATLLN